MHCKSLGIDKVLLGSVLWLVVHTIMPDAVEINLGRLWADIEEVYQELGTENRYGQMKMTMFTTKSAPKLKGKAADIKDLGPVLAKIWKKYYNAGLEIHRKIFRDV